MKLHGAVSVILLATRALAGPSTSQNPAETAIYKSPHASIEARVEDLLSRMTLEEKQAQLMQGNVANFVDKNYVVNRTALQNVVPPASGAIYAALIPRYALAIAINETQDYLLHNTRLGIPALMQSEGIHGYLDENSTIFMSPIGMACSFNPELLSKVSGVIGSEAASVGVTNIFAPVLDLSRELRWGRVEENYGEDPFLTGEMGRAYVIGLQSGKRPNTAKSAQYRLASMVKHFVAFGSPEGGVNTAPVAGGERDLRSLYLPPFKRAIVDGGALSVMSGYSPNPVPARLALEAGNDMEMGGSIMHYVTVAEQVQQKQLSMSVVDDAVRRVLRVKFQLGLFENPWSTSTYNSTIHTQSSVALAQQMDEEAIVLLENDGTLPISPKVSSVAVIGPQANVMQYGDYVQNGVFDRGITPLAGIKALVGGSVKINYAEGCKLWSNDQSGFKDAVEAAKQSKVAVVMVGTWTRDQTLLWQGLNATTGEHVDVNDLGLVGAQLDLVKAVQATGTPTVVVYVSGKPISEPWIKDNINAIVQEFYPSEQGGAALANILFGKVNPSGKLSVSFPTYVGSLPSYYNYYNGGRSTSPGYAYSNGTLVFGHQYVLGTPQPMWLFGHGLSYTTFNYTSVKMQSSTVRSSSKQVNVEVSVTNTGKVDGKEVVQVYVNDVVSSVVTPNLALKGFKKVSIKAGQTVTVVVPINIQDLAVWTTSNQYVVEP
ncbi:hypothetical protein BZG36_04510, partial [Bifiguratus adelaidae]